MNKKTLVDSGDFEWEDALKQGFHCEEEVHNEPIIFIILPNLIIIHRPWCMKTDQ